MTRLAKLLQPLMVVGALTMIPLTTSTLAAADANTMKELDTFMDVFNQVRANYQPVSPTSTPCSGAN